VTSCYHYKHAKNVVQTIYGFNLIFRQRYAIFKQGAQFFQYWETIMRFFVLLIALCTVLFAQSDTIWTETWIPVRTGDSLAGDVFSLDTTVAKPTILIQTPYNKVSFRGLAFYADLDDTSGVWNFQHYNFVTVDWRGFYASSDADSAGYDRGKDGYDIVEWIASQSWSDGNVGTYGGSALGAIQFMTAEQNPPHLVCAAPWIKDFRTNYTDYFYGGVFRKEHSEALSFLGFTSGDFILEHPIYSPIWAFVELNSDHPEDFHVPMLMVSGWFDHFPSDIIADFHAIRDRSDIAVRDEHKLIMGPWTHSGVGDLLQGELEYPAAEDFQIPITKKFFDHYLRGAENGYESEPVGQYFLMGSDTWLETDNWFSMIDSADTLYLHADGYLTPDSAPVSTTPPDSFRYDPRDPSPAYGCNRFNPADPGLVVGPRDMRDSVEARDDNLIYTTDILTEPLTVTGRITARLFVESNCLDTDFAIRISDVYPDGRSMVLTQGILRGRLRDTLGVEHLMVPDIIYEIEVETEVIAQTFLLGHRLRLVVSSAIYPHFDTNINDGGPMYEEGDTTIATNFVHHSDIYPSALILPTSSTVTVAERKIPLPERLDIRAYPNPFNSAVTINLDNRSESRSVEQVGYGPAGEGVSDTPLRVEIYDVNGRRIATVTEPVEVPGGFAMSSDFNAKHPSTSSGGVYVWRPSPSLGSGVYLVRASVGEQSVARRIIYLK